MSAQGQKARSRHEASITFYDDVTYVYDDVTYVYDDVTYVSPRAKGPESPRGFNNFL